MGSIAKKKRPPARTPEAREKRLVALALDVAEKQLEEGTASAQVITHFLKLGTERDRLERERIRADTEVSKAKIKNMEIAERTEEKYQKAIDAMRLYQGHAQAEELYDDPDL